MNTTKKAKPLFARVLAVILALALLIPGLAPQPAQAEGGETATSNWDEPVPKDDPNYWPIDPAKIIEHGIGGIKVAMPTYIGKENNVLDVGFYFYYGTRSPEYTTLQLRVDTDLADKIESITCENEDSHYNYTFNRSLSDPLVYEANIYERKKGRGILKSPGGATAKFNRIIKIHLKPGTIIDQDYLIQSRVVTDEGKVWTKRNLHTFCTNISKEKQNIPPLGNFNYATSTMMDIEYDPEKGILKVYHKFNHKFCDSTKKPGPAYTSQISPILWDLLPNDGPAVRTYLVDHENENAWSHQPLLWNKSDMEVIESPNAENVAVLKFAGSTYYFDNNNDKPKAMLHPAAKDRDPNKYLIHDGITVNPAGMCIEYFIDPVKLTEAFGKNEYTQKIAVKGFYSKPESNKQNAEVKMYPNTFANSAILFEKTFYEPKVNDVFTEDNKVTGKTKYAEAAGANIPIYVKLPKQSDSVTAKTTTTDFEVPVTGLKKDMQLRVANLNTVDKSRVYVPSEYVPTKVKAHVIFNLNDSGGVEANFAKAGSDYLNTDAEILDGELKDGKLVVIAPPNEKNWGEEGYVPNGLRYSYKTSENADVSYNLMPAEPTREGYKFKGWLFKPNLYFSGNTAVEETMEVYADWAKGYEITFDGFAKKQGSDTFEENIKVVSENGVLPESSEFPIAKVPADQQGKKFVGWYTEQGGNGIKVPDETNYQELVDNGLIQGDKITLYPRFESEPTYTLEFLDKTNGNALVGKMSPKSFSDDFYGAETKLPAGAQPSEITGRRLSKNVLQEKILKAKVYAQAYDEGENITYDDIYEFVDPADTTYTVKKDIAQKASDKNQNLIIYLRPKTFNITYKVATNEDGYEAAKSWPNGLANPNQATYTFLDPAFKLLGVEREGYVFKGWIPERELDNVEEKGFREVTVPFNRPEHKVYVAGYDKIYKINYVNFAPEPGDTNYPTTFSAGDSGNITIAQVPTKAGYSFKGWKLNGGDLSDSITIDKTAKADQTVEAVWEPAFDIVSGPTIKSVAGNGKEDSAGTDEAGKIKLLLAFPTGFELGDTIDVSYIGDDGQVHNLPQTVINTQEKLEKGWITIPMDAYTAGNRIASASKEKAGRAVAEKIPPAEGDRTGVTITFTSKSHANVSKTMKMYYVADTSKMEAAYAELFKRVYGRVPTADNYKPTDEEREHPLVTVPEMIDKIDEGIVIYEDPAKYPADPNARPITQLLIDQWALEVDELLERLATEQTKAPSEVTAANNVGDNFTTITVKSPANDPDNPDNKYVEGDRITLQLPDGQMIRLTVEKESEVTEPRLGKAVVNDDGTITIQLADGTEQKKLSDGDTIDVMMEKEIKEGEFSPISEATTGTVVDKNPVIGTPVVEVEKPSGNIKVQVNDPLADRVVVNNGTNDITFEKDPEGNWKRTDGSSEYSVTQDKDGNIVFVIPTEAEKEALNGKEVTATISNKDNTGEGGQPVGITSDPVRYDIKAPKEPTVEKVTAGDTQITIKAPDEEDAKEITVTVGDKTATITKGDDGKWKNGDKTFEVDEDGNLIIDIDPPVTAEELTPGKEIKVSVKDGSGNASKPTTAVVQKQDLPAAEKPTQEGNTVKSTVTGTVPEGTKAFLTNEAGNKISAVDGRPITKQNRNLNDAPIEGTISNGSIEITIPDGAKVKDNLNNKKVKVALEKEDMNPSVSEAGDNPLDTKAPESVLPRGTQGTNELQIKVPTDDTQKITVTIPGEPGESPETITLEKDGDTWKKGDETVTVNDEGFLVIPTTNPLPEETVTIVSEDEVGNQTTTEFTPTEQLTTAPPSDVKVIKDEEGYKVVGKAPAGSTVEVKKPNGESYDPKKTATANNEGKFEITLPADYTDGDTVTVTATGENEKESPEAKATVDMTPPNLPNTEAKEGDNKVVIKPPIGDATQIKVIIDNEVAVMVKKEDGTWQKEDGTEIPLEEDGSLVIPLPEGKTIPYEDIVIEAKDDAGNTSVHTVKPTPMAKSDKPVITEVVKDDQGNYKVKGTAPAGATVEIKQPNGTGYEPPKTVTAGEDGTFTIDVPADYTGEEGANTLTLTAKEDGKKESEAITRPFDKTAPAAPTVTAPTLKDPVIKINKPEDDVVKEVITIGEDPGAKEVILDKDSAGNWKSNDPDFDVTKDETGNLIVTPVNDESLAMINKKDITVQATDSSNNVSDPSEAVNGQTISDLDAPTRAKVNRLNNTQMRVIGKAKPNETVVIKDGDNFINKEDGTAITPQMLVDNPDLKEKIATAKANERGTFKTNISVITENGEEVGEKPLTAHVYTGDVANPSDISEGTPFVTPKAVQTPPADPAEESLVTVNKLYNYDMIIRGEHRNVDRIEIVITREKDGISQDYVLIPTLNNNGTYEQQVWIGNEEDANRIHSGDSLRVKGFKNGKQVLQVNMLVD